MRIRKSGSQAWSIFETIASNEKGGGVMYVDKTGSLRINMTAGKYGTIRYVVELEPREVEKLYQTIERWRESEKDATDLGSLESANLRSE